MSNTIVGSKYLKSVPSTQYEVPDVPPPVPVSPLLVKDVPADVKRRESRAVASAGQMSDIKVRSVTAGRDYLQTSYKMN